MSTENDGAGAPCAPQLELGQIQRFMLLLTEPNEQLHFMTGPELETRTRGPGSIRPSPQFDTFQKLIGWLSERNEKNCAAWLNPQKHDEKGRLAALRVFVAEMTQRKDDWPLKPSVAVETSPNHIDYYWKLSEPLSPLEYTSIANRLIKQYAAESDTQNPSKVRRLPGTWNRKSSLDEPFLATLLSAHGASYSKVQLAHAFPPLAEGEDVIVQQKIGEIDLKQYIDKLLKIDPLALEDTPTGKQYTTLICIGRALYLESRGNDVGFGIWQDWANGFPILKGGAASSHPRASELEALWPTFARPDADGSQPTGQVIYALAAAARDEDSGLIERATLLQLEKDGSDRVKKDINNLRAYLEYTGTTLRYNEFSFRMEVVRNGKIEILTDPIVNEIWVEAEQAKLPFAKEKLFGAIEYLARRNHYHPIRDEYFPKLQWDAKTRLDSMAETYLGVACGDSNLKLDNTYLRKFMIAMVRRILQPGCKFDIALILIGAQGAGKSSFARELATPPFFNDGLWIGSRPKDTAEQTAGKWVVEFAELAGMTEKRNEAIKAWLSRQVDTYNAKYDKLTTDAPRQFVCIGTTNEDTFLHDQTGNRRYWCIKVGKEIDWRAIARDRDQLFAEALIYEATSEALELPVALRATQAREAAQRVVSEPWQERLEQVIDDDFRGAIELDAIWKHLGITGDKNSSLIGKKILKIMNAMGFEKERRRRADSPYGNPKPHCYIRGTFDPGTALPWLDLGIVTIGVVQPSGEIDPKRKISSLIAATPKVS